MEILFCDWFWNVYLYGIYGTRTISYRINLNLANLFKIYNRGKLNFLKYYILTLKKLSFTITKAHNQNHSVIIFISFFNSNVN